MLKDEKVFKELIKRTSAPETSSERKLIFESVEIIRARHESIRRLQDEIDRQKAEISKTYLYNYDGGRYCELLSILHEMDDEAEA